jgi:hypothetical protein
MARGGAAGHPQDPVRRSLPRHAGGLLLPDRRRPVGRSVPGRGPGRAGPAGSTTFAAESPYQFPESHAPAVVAVRLAGQHNADGRRRPRVLRPVARHERERLRSRARAFALAHGAPFSRTGRGSRARAAVLTRVPPLSPMGVPSRARAAALAHGPPLSPTCCRSRPRAVALARARPLSPTGLRPCPWAFSLADAPSLSPTCLFPGPCAFALAHGPSSRPTCLSRRGRAFAMAHVPSLVPAGLGRGRSLIVRTEATSFVRKPPQSSSSPLREACTDGRRREVAPMRWRWLRSTAWRAR